MSRAGIGRDLKFFVLVKSQNRRQNVDGTSTFLNYHVFGEIFLASQARLRSAIVHREGAEDRARRFRPHGDDVLGDNAWYAEGEWYRSEDEVNARFPNGRYAFHIELASDAVLDAVVRLEGRDGENEIPTPPIISLTQNDVSVRPDRLDPEVDTVVRWGDYELGRADPRGIVDDLVFVVVADCYGARIVKSGLCFEKTFLTYRDTSYTIPAGTLSPGRPHSMFVELPHVSDSVIVDGVPGFASFASATYLDLRTLGEPSGPPCSEDMRPLDTGETDRLRPARAEDREALMRLTGDDDRSRPSDIDPR